MCEKASDHNPLQCSNCAKDLDIEDILANAPDAYELTGGLSCKECMNDALGYVAEFLAIVVSSDHEDEL